MRLFTCDACSNVVHFDNTVCLSCSRRLGFDPVLGRMTALEPHEGSWRSVAAGIDRAFCDNARHDACNWLCDGADPGQLCLACRHNRTIPDLSVAGHLVAFRRLTLAERHLFYSLDRWALPAPTKGEAPEDGLAFDFLADEFGSDGARTPVMTGHANGVITLAVSETDDAQREARRNALGERYRTLLGHFRHEIGHYYWDRLVRDGARLEAFRALFGDEREDYAGSLARHYDQGPPPGWQTRFVSAYATAHPWEDFAESWAHYMHMVDALETARALGMNLSPRSAPGDTLDLALDFSPYRETSFERIRDAWPALTVAINAINRSLGQPDLYPFVLSEAALEKLAFVHALVHDPRS